MGHRKWKGENLQMISLAGPLFLELVLRTLLGNIDQLMLSRYSQNAVAAVGNANQLLNMMILVLQVVCIASGILIARYIGAGRREELAQIYTLTICISICFGFLLSGVVFLKAPIMKMMKIPNELMKDMGTYLTVVAGGFVLQGISMSFSAIFRSNAMVKEIMVISIASNVVNVLGNMVLIHGAGAIPALGVLGAAISTLLGQLSADGAFLILYLKKIKVPFDMKLIRRPDKGRMAALFRLGLPAAGDSISYNTMQLVMLTLINGYGAAAVAAKVYASMVIIFVYMCSSSIAQASQIRVGYMVGAGQYEPAGRLVMKSVKLSVGISLVLACLLHGFSDRVFSLFTEEAVVLEMIRNVTFIDIFLELGRAVNMVMVNCLLAAGDTKFPLLCAVSSMWGVAVPAGYLMGDVLGMGIEGIWIGLAMDEWCRAAAFLLRWKSNVWQKRSVL